MPAKPSPRAFAAAFVALLALAAPAGAQTPAGPLFAVPGGTIRAALEGDVVAAKGIPYAAPPLGRLRWRAPQPVVAWEGVRDATRYGADCMQVPVDDEAAPIGTTPAEDCLFVNVWRPASVPAGTRLPVLVWIHGGGFVNGGSSAPVLAGAELARRGLVVVSLNYRLGRLGFFAHPALIAAREGAVGNFGTMDQIAALSWVRDSIAVFGGDPGAVTLVGESAGGASVLTLLTVPAARGLFQRAMILSGGGRQALLARPMTGGTPLRPAAADGDAAFAAARGIAGTGADALERLRALPAAEVVAGVSLPILLDGVLKGTAKFDGTPMIDGTLVTAIPQDVFAAAAEAPVPVVIGTTALDLPLQFPRPPTEPFAWFGDDATAARAAYDPTGGALPLPLVLLGIGADMTMHEPARFVARKVSAAGRRAWLYRFTYAAQSAKDRANGAGHAQELPYLFGTVDARYGSAATDADRAVAVAFSGYAVNFAKTGDPNGPGLPRWPAFDPAATDLMNFTLDKGPEFGADPRAARVKLVEKVADRLAAAPR
ncbi:MAG: carboxylesterase family protein [Bauldia sp.]